VEISGIIFYEIPTHIRSRFLASISKDTIHIYAIAAHGIRAFKIWLTRVNTIITSINNIFYVFVEMKNTLTTPNKPLCIFISTDMIRKSLFLGLRLIDQMNELLYHSWYIVTVKIYL